jgi:AmmeMemoRadiSam system protein A
MSERLTPDEERSLLALARRAIEHYFETGETLRPAVDDPKFRDKRGAFVTLKVSGELRGCVGYPLPLKPLADAVAEMAVAAASQDFRFDPLTLEELTQTKIEISVLSLPEPIQDPKKVEVGRDGIIVSKGYNRGLLLPQVPLEHDWDRETYLRHGCLKAGLASDEWKKGAKIEVFTAQVFSEPE